jgi:hypothetical protein
VCVCVCVCGKHVCVRALVWPNKPKKEIAHSVFLLGHCNHATVSHSAASCSQPHSVYFALCVHTTVSNIIHYIHATVLKHRHTLCSVHSHTVCAMHCASTPQCQTIYTIPWYPCYSITQSYVYTATQCVLCTVRPHHSVAQHTLRSYYNVEVHEKVEQCCTFASYDMACSTQPHSACSALHARTTVSPRIYCVHATVLSSVAHLHRTTHTCTSIQEYLCTAYLYHRFIIYQDVYKCVTNWLKVPTLHDCIIFGDSLTKSHCTRTIHVDVYTVYIQNILTTKLRSFTMHIYGSGQHHVKSLRLGF